MKLGNETNDYFREEERSGKRIVPTVTAFLEELAADVVVVAAGEVSDEEDDMEADDGC